MDVLIRACADVQVADLGGNTPLHYAARAGNLRHVAALLNHGAEVHAKKGVGLTPLGYLAIGGQSHPEVLFLASRS